MVLSTVAFKLVLLEISEFIKSRLKLTKKHWVIKSYDWLENLDSFSMELIRMYVMSFRMTE